MSLQHSALRHILGRHTPKHIFLNHILQSPRTNVMIQKPSLSTTEIGMPRTAIQPQATLFYVEA